MGAREVCGGDLTGASEAGGPRFLVDARKDPGTSRHPGTDLYQRMVVGHDSYMHLCYRLADDKGGADAAPAGDAE